jgi:hypothetical protein
VELPLCYGFFLIELEKITNTTYQFVARQNYDLQAPPRIGVDLRFCTRSTFRNYMSDNDLHDCDIPFTEEDDDNGDSMQQEQDSTTISTTISTKIKKNCQIKLTDVTFSADDQTMITQMEECGNALKLFVPASTVASKNCMGNNLLAEAGCLGASCLGASSNMLS